MNQTNEMKNPFNTFDVNTEAYVRGQVKFCRIARLIEGKALEDDANRKRSIGKDPITVPYTSLTIIAPQVVPKTPGEKSAFEAFLESERFYVSTKYGDVRFEAISKNPKKLPEVGHYQESSGTYKPVVLQGELAEGATVMMKVRVFAGKASNHGMNLDAVMVMDPEVRYYGSSGDVMASLAQRGMVQASAT